MLQKTIPLEVRIEDQPYGTAGILYQGTLLERCRLPVVDVDGEF